MEFEWDENKNWQNQQKHGVSFEEAQEIFLGVVLLLSVTNWIMAKFER
jgi:uncharacterized DUF497 family protein